MQVRLVLVCVFGPVNVVLALLIWWRMGYLIFNTIGTNKTLVCEPPPPLHLHTPLAHSTSTSTLNSIPTQPTPPILVLHHPQTCTQLSILAVHNLGFHTQL